MNTNANDNTSNSNNYDGVSVFLHVFSSIENNDDNAIESKLKVHITITIIIMTIIIIIIIRLLKTFLVLSLFHLLLTI